MNELELLRTLDEEIGLPHVGELAVARERLTAAIAAEPRPRHAPAARVCLAAAAAAAVVLIAVGAHSGRVRLPAPAPPIDLTAAQVLNHAAFVAVRAGGVAPRPRQFVYTRTKVIDGGIVTSWLSVDGTRGSVIDGHAIPGCPKTAVPRRRVGTGWQSCVATPAYFPAMPTRASAMWHFLRRTEGVRHRNLNDLAKTVGSLLDSDYLLGAQQAALFAFLARTHGITVVPHATDAAGRSGVGVGWSLPGGRSMLIFDPATYRYLGTATQGTHGQVSGTALLQTAIVDRLGQVPPPGASQNA